jgi:hypothetical protein
MGKKFTITESERNYIMGLYEQPTPENIDGQNKTYEITGGSYAGTKGNIVISPTTMDVNVKLYKTDFSGKLNILKKSGPPTDTTYFCDGDIMGYDKHQIRFADSYQKVMWSATSTFNNTTLPPFILKYRI